LFAKFLICYKIPFMKGKHILYYEFTDALQNGECPICAIIKKRRERYFEHILSEQVNDIGFRKELRSTHGFCNFHTYMFYSFRKPLASSIIYEDLFLTEIEFLKKDKIVPAAKECIVCKIEREAEKEALEILQNYLKDSEFKKIFLDSKGLCVPHYKKAVLKMGNVPKWFKDFHIRRFEEITKTLHKYIDAQNVSLGEKRPKLTREEELEWKEAMRIFAGLEGLKW